MEWIDLLSKWCFVLFYCFKIYFWNLGLSLQTLYLGHLHLTFEAWWSKGNQMTFKVNVFFSSQQSQKWMFKSFLRLLETSCLCCHAYWLTWSIRVTKGLEALRRAGEGSGFSDDILWRGFHWLWLPSDLSYRLIYEVNWLSSVRKNR